ncbi:MAG: tetratricopeptide repeat protein [Gemmatimonadota bacterium]
MTRKYLNHVTITATVFSFLGLPAIGLAQECGEGGNRHTRAADIELSWSKRRDDPQTKQERYARALEKLEVAFAESPDESRAYLLAGEAYLGLRDYAGADSMLTKLVSMNGACEEMVQEIRFQTWVGLYNSGINKLSAGAQDEALASFETASLIYEDARSLNNAASIYQNQGENTRAADLYQRALDAGSDDADMVRVATINLAELLRAEGRTEESLALYSSYLADHPEDVIGRLNYAISLLNQQRSEEAQAIFGELLGREDLTFRQWTQVGIGLYRANNFTEAATAFGKAHEMRPLSKEVTENLANTLYQVSDFEGLSPIAKSLTDMYPYESRNYNLLANAHRELGDPEAALAVLQRRDGLSFEFLSAQLVAQGENVYVVEGQVMNRSAEAGTQVSVLIELLDESGEVVASETLLLELPDADEASAFQVQLEVENEVAGFKYAMAQ